MEVWKVGFRWLWVIMLGCWNPAHQVMGQLTARNTNGSAVTSYTNVYGTRDTIFAFNQTPQPQKGNLSLQYRPVSTITWTWQKPNTTGFVSYKTFRNVTQTAIDTLSAGQYRITVANDDASKTVECTVDTVKNSDGNYTVSVTSGGKTTDYINAAPKGRFTVAADPLESTFKWYRFDYQARAFEASPFATITDAMATSADTLSQGGYKVSVTPKNEAAPRDSFVAWLYMNPGFDFELFQNDNGEVIHSYKQCTYTDFLVDANTPIVQSSFLYYDPATQRQSTLENKITFYMGAAGNESVVPLNQQGSQQYFRDYFPPTTDTRYSFRGVDLFGVEHKRDIMYNTIIPDAVMAVKLPETDPTSAPVYAGFTTQPSANIREYLWRFGDGDSIRYGDDTTPLPDTVKHTYYTPKKYTAVLFVTSRWGCLDSTSLAITVDPSKLHVANVFTPNGDNMNDYFKPDNTSIRQFEISIYTRAGKRVYHYKGSDLRSWQGWDGRIQNSGKDAAVGVYFYVIKAPSWDNPSVLYQQGGSLHLYR